MYERLIKQYSAIFDKLAEHFQCTSQDIVINKQFSEGKSGDVVLLICVQKAAIYSDCGSYVLKIFSSESVHEEIGHTYMANEHTDGTHILTPTLRLFGMSPPFYLYDKAGDEFMHATSLSELEPYTTASCLVLLSQNLMSEWNANPQLCQESLYSLIRNWLGEQRLEPFSRLSQRIEAQITDELAVSFRFHKRSYPNPLYYLLGDSSPLAMGKANLQCVLYGQIHGDLNANNIIAQKLPGNTGYQFTLIDFEQYRPQAPLLFDQAYLLLCVLMQDAESSTLIEWSEKIEIFFNCLRELGKLQSRNKPPFSYMQAHLDAMKYFINHQQQHNRSAVVWQLLAAHVAVGLNFLNKRSIGDRQQKMALLYASSALRALLESLDIAVDEWTDPPSLQSGLGENPELWRQVDRFSPDNRYILLTSCSEDTATAEIMQYLSPIKWLMVIEMNCLTENPIRDQILPIYKRSQGYRIYEIPSEERFEFEAAPTWLHLSIPTSQKNLTLYYNRYLQRELRQCLSAALSIRENEHLFIISDFTDIEPTLGQALLQDILLQAGENTLVHIISLNDFPLDFDPEESLHCIISKSSLADLGRSVHLFLDTHYDPTEVRIPHKDGMRRISPELVSNLSNDMVLVHRNITYAAKDDNGEGFYHGNEVTWLDIANGRDVLRLDYETHLKDLITSKLEQVSTGAGTVLKLFHRPGGGGTTLSRRIAWDFCVKYPTVMLHTLSSQTAERLKELYRTTVLPILVIAEISDGQISQDRISMLRRELIPKSIRVLFLFVSRTTNRERSRTDNTFYLPNTENLSMASEEAQMMYERFSGRLRLLAGDEEYAKDISQRIEDLGLLTYAMENVELRQPFFYGLYTYGSGFRGITKYVEHNIQNCNPNERKTLQILSMITVFSQSVNLSFEETALFLYPDEKVILPIAERVKDWMYTQELVVRRGRGSRICHPIIAEEILRQSNFFHPSPKEDGFVEGTDELVELAFLFIDRMVNYYGAESTRLNDVFHDMFIHRTMVYEEESQKFSALLTRLYTRERCTRLMLHLVKAIPENPHYRNHLARLYLYPVTPEQKIYPDAEIALKYANEAIQCAKKQDKGGLAIHYHVLGKAYAKKCTSKLRETLIKSSLAKAFAVARPSYISACDAFTKCIAEDKSGYGLTGKLELYSSILNVIKTMYGRNAPLSAILTRKDNARPETVNTISSYIAEGGDLINHYIRQFDTDSAAFRSACLRFYSAIGKLDKLEVVFNANALTQKERCIRNRAIATVLMESGFRDDKSFSYDQMPLNHLQELYRRMKENIAAINDNEQDRVRWLEAFRRLPEFQLKEAYQFLIEWPDADKNLFVCYYRYVIAFLMHIRTGDVTYDEFKHHLNQTIDLSRNAYGKDITASINYYGAGDSSTELLVPRPAFNSEDLKEERIEQNKDYRKAKCEILQGWIDDIGDGLITIRFHYGNNKNTFIAKSPNIYQMSLADVGRPVTFYLGFSYSGMRSWDVQLSPQQKNDFNVTV